MRCSCAHSRLAALAVLPVLAACASAPPAPDGGDPFPLEGVLGVEGPDPFGRSLRLTDDEGTVWRLDPGRLDHELSRLDGHRVRLFCRRGSGHGETAMSVSRYELLPVDGREPLYGVLRTVPGEVTMETAGTVMRLEGPLSEALAGFGGHAVWVWGDRGSRDTMIVVGYAVIGPVSAGP